MTREGRPRRRWVKVVGVTVLAVVLVVTGGLVGISLWLFSKPERFDVAFPDGDSSEVWLIVGLDDREVAEDAGVAGDVGGAGPGARADIVLLAMPRADGLHILSIDRGLLLYDGQSVERIGASWLNGPGRSVELLCDGLGVKADHVIAVNFLTIVNVVDELGGIDVDLPHALRDEPAHLDVPAGTQRVDGRTALALVRSRQGEISVDGRWKPEPEGSVGRQDRAGMVLSALLERAGDAGPVRLVKAASTGLESVGVDSGTGFFDLLALWPSELEFTQLTLRHLTDIEYAAELTQAGESQLDVWRHGQCTQDDD